MNILFDKFIITSLEITEKDKANNNYDIFVYLFKLM